MTNGDIGKKKGKKTPGETTVNIFNAKEMPAIVPSPPDSKPEESSSLIIGPKRDSFLESKIAEMVEPVAELIVGIRGHIKNLEDLHTALHGGTLGELVDASINSGNFAMRFNRIQHHADLIADYNQQLRRTTIGTARATLLQRNIAVEKDALKELIPDFDDDFRFAITKYLNGLLGLFGSYGNQFQRIFCPRPDFFTNLGITAQERNRRDFFDRYSETITQSLIRAMGDSVNYNPSSADREQVSNVVRGISEDSSVFMADVSLQRVHGSCFASLQRSPVDYIYKRLEGQDYDPKIRLFHKAGEKQVKDYYLPLFGVFCSPKELEIIEKWLV
jgi:hypothetical protein